MRRHRRLLGALTLSLIVVSAAAAQGKVKANFGVLGGADFSKPGGKDATDVKGQYVGFAVGGFVTIQVARAFAIEPEVLYVRKGAKIEPSGGGKGKFRVPYVEIPVLAKFRVPPRGSSIVSPHAYVGPALAFKTGCHASFTDGTTTISGKCDAQPFDAKIKSTDVSLVFGAGVDIGRAMIDARYDLGLSQLDNSGANMDSKNRTFYLLAGWTFRSPH